MSEIINHKSKIRKILEINFNNKNLSDTINIFSDSIKKFKKTYDLIKPDLILILGDRFEIFAAALSAFFYESLLLTYKAENSLWEHKMMR